LSDKQKAIFYSIASAATIVSKLWKIHRRRNDARILETYAS
jgi:hypothetical protein